MIKAKTLLNVAGLIALTFILFQANPVTAQADQSLYFLPIVPHQRNLNPGYIPGYKFYIGIPLLSSVKTGFENTITYDDIFLKKGDSLILDRDYILDNLGDETKINFNLMEEYFSFGFGIQKNYFNFRVADIAQTNIAINKNLLTFLLYGNGSEEYLGQSVNLGGLAFNISYYREYSFGYSRKINEKLNVGINLKYLQGIANLVTESSDFYLYTDPNDYSIRIKSNIEINMSVPGIETEARPKDFLPNPKNKGFAVDFGAEYIINEKFDVFASMLNLGSINWTDNLKNFKSKDPNKEFVYEGFDIDDYFEDNTFDSDKIEKVLDSIADVIGIVETAEPYKSSLPPRLNMGGHFNLTKNDMFSVLIRNQFAKDNNWATASIAYTRKITRDVNIMVSNLFFQGSYFNPGIGFAANLGPVQLYLINENFTAPFAFGKSNMFALRFGINLVYEGKGDSKLINPSEDSK